MKSLQFTTIITGRSKQIEPPFISNIHQISNKINPYSQIFYFYY
ncbi:hypothetical protein BBU64B_F0020 (plasmid) [Borreliella burgdorferi 64b]|nr:hypothetical protein BBU64B_F0020 [Borreliella burgdorferi 64b]